MQNFNKITFDIKDMNQVHDEMQLTTTLLTNMTLD